MRTLLLFTLLLGFASVAAAQQNLQANILTELSVNGNRLGAALEYNYPIFVGQNDNYRLYVGAFEEFFVKNENDIEGIDGSTISNQFGGTVSNQFRFLTNKKLLLTHTTYAGWGYRSTSASYVNTAFNIDRDYSSNYHYFAWGMYWKIGWQLKKISLQAIGKTDFSRLLGEYEPTLFERPGFMYGLGVVYQLN